ncbi:uncharacterized protein J3R85_011726 [Psidium guajava]|nr:uncharacterized protein J3R85_011726 [Psidium guajava]
MPSRAEASSSRTCLCSPTNHPGSFRCSRHKSSSAGDAAGRRAAPCPVPTPEQREPGTASRDDGVKALLLQIINPSRHDPKRKRGFEPRPSRFCLMNGVAVS